MKSKLFSHRTLPEMYNLEVGDGHKIYVEASGKKEGIPVIFIHGGPGGHCRSEHHNMFNPKVFRSIIYDQRGCGKSYPYRSTSNNDTESLVNDLELIRNFFNFGKFMIVGGSWGATLALKYSIHYPNRISAILLRSVFLGTMDEIKWAFIDGPKILAPEIYKQFCSFFSKNCNLIEKYYDEICNKSSKLHSWIWHDYERTLSQINPNRYKFDSSELIEKREGMPNSPKMELHYIKNNFFMEDNEILKNISSLNNIPGYIVQGRYDIICPPVNAFNLSENWTNSKLIIVNSAGHSSADPGITENMLKGLEELSQII